MNYILIRSKGEIQVGALKLMGASTKRDDENKIGMFGSGNKYAISYFMRKGLKPIIFSGKEEIKLGTEKEMFSDKVFDVITINGDKTSITTEMGPKWDLWQALREFYSNALDEGIIEFNLVEDISFKENSTSIFIPTNEDVFTLWNNREKYFNTSRVVLNSVNGSLILEKPKGFNDEDRMLSIFKQTIRCNKGEKGTESLFDYEIPKAELNEERLIASEFFLKLSMARILRETTSVDVVNQLLENINENSFEANLLNNTTINDPGYTFSETWREAIGHKKIIPAYAVAFLKISDTMNLIMLSNNMYKCLKKAFGNEIVSEHIKGSESDNMLYKDYSSDFSKQMLKEVGQFFTECDFFIPYTVDVVEFENTSTYGLALVDEKRILIDKKSFDKGKSFVANTIMEEYIHVKYGVGDETRAFQEAAIDEFLTYMKKKNAYTL